MKKVISQTQKKWTLLSIAAMLLLFVGGAYASEAPLLFAAIIDGNLQGAAKALQDGESPNAIHTGDDANRGRTPLIMAASYDHADIVDLLLRQPHINVNAHSTHDGTTALIEAARNKNWLIAEKLLNAGADIDAVDNHGKSARDHGYKRRRITN